MDWSELILLDGAAGAAPSDQDRSAEDAEGRRGFMRRLRESLRSTRATLGSGFRRTLAEGDWEGLEEALILADVGVSTAVAIGEELQEAARRERLDEDALSERLAEILADTARGGADAEPPVIDLRAKPSVVLMVGVNGTGKTTTLGKLAWQLRERFGLRVLLGAADTYRAAATEQLVEWASRAGCEIVTGAAGLRPGGGGLRGGRAGARRASSTCCSSTPQGACTTRSR